MKIQNALMGLMILMATGCAHPISIKPKIAMLERADSSANRIDSKVGLYIPPASRSTEVTTAGGGGDNVRYFPYRDIEIGFQKILSNVFNDVAIIPCVPAPKDGAGSAIDYIIIPEIITTSGGSGFFTWPPTSFTVDLTSSIRDGEGKPLSTLRVVGVGSAETSERLFEHGIAGRRAMEDALSKMQKSLLESKVFDGELYQHIASNPKINYSSLKVVSYQYDSRTDKGSLSVNISDYGLDARDWVIKNIGKICSSKEVLLEAGQEKSTGGHYRVLNESLKDGVLTIDFSAGFDSH